MPESFEALIVLAFALLPGALYTWGFERIIGKWGVSLADRALRFVGTSALLHAALAPLTYWIWAKYVHSGIAGRGDPLPLWLWLLILAYVAVPLVAGSLVGYGTRDRKEWARFFTGPDPAPRAWDHLFAHRPDGWIRLRLKTGTWIGGAFAKSEEGIDSYASGYPEPQDLFLASVADVDPETGEFIFEDGQPLVRESALLIRWDEVEYLEFIDA